MAVLARRTGADAGLTAVILAAGRGTRMAPLSQLMPKPLLPICNKPIMQYQIEAARQAGIRHITVVVSELRGAIERHFGSGEQLGVSLRYVLDPRPQGIARSLLCAEPFVGERCVIFLGDIFLDLDPLADTCALMTDAELAGVILAKREPDEAVLRRNFAVVVDRSGRVRQVVEKPTRYYSDLKGVGVYLFDHGIFEAIRRTPISSLRGECELTDAIQVYIDMGARVRVSPPVQWDINVTSPTDLLDANLFYLRRLDLPRMVGSGCAIGTGVRLERAIIGDRTHISGPAEICESVIFCDVTLSAADARLRRCLVTTDRTWELAPLGLADGGAA